MTNFLTVFLRKLKQKKILIVSCNGSSSQLSLHPFRIFYQRLNNLFHLYQKNKTKEKGISVPLLHSGCFKKQLRICSVIPICLSKFHFLFSNKIYSIISSDFITILQFYYRGILSHFLFQSQNLGKNIDDDLICTRFYIPE